MLKNQSNLKPSQNLRKGVLALLTITSLFFFSGQIGAQSKMIELEKFDHIVVSPHIEVVFLEGNEASVKIESISVPMEKLNVEVENKKLHLYLDGAKITSPNIKDQVKGTSYQSSLYDGTIVKAVVTYDRRLKTIDLRGEQKFVFESTIDSRKLRLRIYGESQVQLNEVEIDELNVSMYGESELEILKGEIESQVYKVYGESEVIALGIQNEETKVTVYGEGEFQLNVSKKLKVTSYGEATIEYAGGAELLKGIVIGETEIRILGKKNNS